MMRESLVCVVSGLLMWLSSPVSATYISWKSSEEEGLHQKSNQLYPAKRHGPAFKNDKDIGRYLKLYGTESMLWRCKNAIQPYWDWKPIAVLDNEIGSRNHDKDSVELYCEVLGVLDKLEWFHNGQKITLGGRYGQTIVPHFAGGQYYAKWIDFRLKIYNATRGDSGVYTFRITGVDGRSEEQTIYVDISEKKKKKKRERKGDRDRKDRKRQLKQLRRWRQKQALETSKNKD